MPCAHWCFFCLKRQTRPSFPLFSFILFSLSSSLSLYLSISIFSLWLQNRFHPSVLASLDLNLGRWWLIPEEETYILSFFIGMLTYQGMKMQVNSFVPVAVSS